VRKTRYILTGLALGILAQLGSFVAAFIGTNMFHGGHANGIACLLLPGIFIIDHLSSLVPRLIPEVIIVVSLVQFPVYGILGGYHYATNKLPRTMIGLVVLHLAASGIAGYGYLLDKLWQKDSENYGICIRSHADADAITNNSAQITRLVISIEQYQKGLERLRAQKSMGAVFSPDPEQSLDRDLENANTELERRWQSYLDAGGQARSPDAVTVIPNPCGNVPTRPMLF